MHDPTELVRVALRRSGEEVDLVLPVDIPIHELLPAALDLLTNRTHSAADFQGRELQLAKPGLEPFDSRRPLSEYGVRDGDLLILTNAQPRHRQPLFDTCSGVRVAVAAAAVPWSTQQRGRAAEWLLGWLTVVIGAALACPLLGRGTTRLCWVGVACCLLIFAAAIVARNRLVVSHSVVMLGTSFSLLVGLTAASMLPGQAGRPHLLLGMSVCSVSAMGFGRLLRCGTRVLIPLSAVTAAAAAISAGALSVDWPAPAIGAILIGCSFAVLSAAPRLATRLAGLTPLEPIETDHHGALANQALTDVTTIAAGLAGLGAVMLAAANPSVESAALIGAVTAKLVLHARTQSESHRVGTLIATATITGTTLLCVLATTHPGALHWLCLGSVLSVGAAIGVLPPTGERRSIGASAECGRAATLSHVLGVLEFAITAAAVPLSSFAAGLPSAIRGASFS
jgi:type VII secretion integral membrane protein EccD